jgi:penicillin-binding protein 1A
MRSFLRFIKKLFILGVVILGIVVLGLLYYIEFQLPDIKELNTVHLQVPLQIYTQDGKLIAEYGEIRRIPLPYSQIPKQLIDAVLATEDQRYFQHPGIDIPGLMRAGIKLIATGRKEQGGSTITMQVARTFYLTRHKTFGRKLREILLALKIDHTLSKQKILELYLNKIFFGSRAYGVEAAAEIYYGKSLNQLRLDQFAIIAGLPKAPSALNPLTNPVAAKKRRDHVLARMYELQYIDQKAYEKALAAPLDAHYHELQTEIKAPYVGELVRQQLQQMYGDTVYTNGYKVYTTIDSQLQILANQVVRANLLAYDQRHGYRGPEGNMGVPDLKQMEEWEKKLNNIPIVNGLEPAVVIDITANTITVLRANGSLSTISWQGLSWARRQINDDYLDRYPKTASDIVKLGDLVRITATPEGYRLTQLPKAEAGIVALNPNNGQILAMVGGFDYQTSKFNRITSANRQPGSSFKPFIYSAALEKGYTLATIINDAPVVIENPIDNSLWRPQNSSRRFYGPTRLREGLTLSRNLVSIRLLDLIGISYAIKHSQKFGFTKSQLPPSLSLALGTALVTPLQMASAYAIFANGGFKIVPFAIDSIKDGEQVIFQAKPLTACSDCPPQNNKDTPDTTHAPQVLSSQNAFLITSALQDAIQRGAASLTRNLNRKDLAGKTGTTQNQVDAWFAGYNKEIVTITWLGFDHEQRSLHEYGAQAALPMWIDFMQTALKGHPEQSIDQPPGIVSVRIDPQTGKRASIHDPIAKFEYFMSPFVPEDDPNLMTQDNTTAPHEEIMDNTEEAY